MSKVRQVALSFCALIFIVLLPGCYEIKSLISPVMDIVWRKDNIQFEGFHYRRTGKKEYTRLFIGSPTNHIVSFPPIYIEWSKGRKIFLPTLTVESLKSLDVKLANGIATMDHEQPYWPYETAFYRGRSTRENPWHGGYVFAVIDNKIVGFLVDKYGHGFWNQSLTKHYTFPLSPQEAEEVFGKPDEVYEFYQD